MAIFTILYGNYYPPHGKFKLMCIGKFARRTWVNFTQQYGKNRQRCQKNKFTMLYGNYCYIFINNFPQKFSPCNVAMKYFGIIDKNVAAIFQLQWKIGNISDMFLQYYVLCGMYWSQGENFLQDFSIKNLYLLLLIDCVIEWEGKKGKEKKIRTDSPRSERKARRATQCATISWRTSVENPSGLENRGPPAVVSAHQAEQIVVFCPIELNVKHGFTSIWTARQPEWPEWFKYRLTGSL